MTNTMSGKSLEAYRKLLLKIKEEILHDIQKMSCDSGNNDTESRDVSGHVLHMADVATDMYDKEFSLGLASNEREVLGKIDLALKRIEDGSYGECMECGKKIPASRLKAIPYAQTCLKCQEELENEK